VNLLRELKKYSWKTDPKTGDLLDEPVPYENHCCDGGRYASYHFHKPKAQFFSQ